MRADAFLDQLGGAGEVELGLMQIGLGALDGRFLQRDIGLGDGEARFLLAHPGGEGRRLDAGEHLALLHLGGEVGIELADIAGELRADLHRAERAHRARGRDDAAHVGARGGDRLHVELGGRPAAANNNSSRLPAAAATKTTVSQRVPMEPAFPRASLLSTNGRHANPYKTAMI